jgi:uncharacterized protein (TIGR02594 family)
MPGFQYWISAATIAALALLVLLVITAFARGSRVLCWTSATAGGLLALGAIWLAASQAEIADLQKRGLLESVNRLALAKTQVVTPLTADAPAWLKVAYKELGQAEIAGVQENARISEYFATVAAPDTVRDDGDDWASAFVEWSLQHAGLAGPKSMRALAWLGWGQPADQPQPGTIVVLDFAGHDHVGFYFGDEGEFVKVLGGDQNDSVSIYLYPKGAILGYRKPS